MSDAWLRCATLSHRTVGLLQRMRRASETHTSDSKFKFGQVWAEAPSPAQSGQRLQFVHTIRVGVWEREERQHHSACS